MFTRRLLDGVVSLSSMREPLLSVVVVSGLVCTQVCSLRPAQVGRDRTWLTLRSRRRYTPSARTSLTRCACSARLGLVVSMPMSVREFHCKRLTASEAGDYFQVLFEGTPDSDEGYVLVQRQFESPDRGECYVETSDADFCGHFRIRTAQLSKSRFRMAFGDRSVNQITVSFNATDSAYAKAKRVLQIMIPDLELG